MLFKLTTAAMLLCISAKGQQKEGTILYKKTMNLHRTILNEQMKAIMPEFRISNHQLLFSDSISVFKLIPQDETPDPFAGSGRGGTTMVFNGRGSNTGELFKDISKNKTVQVTEIGGRNYLITDSIKHLSWKLTEENKQILGYTCFKAVAKKNGSTPMLSFTSLNGKGKTDSTITPNNSTKQIEIVAWFTTSIPTPIGPESYGELPGAILEINIDNGVTIFEAVEVKASVNKKELVVPKKGKEITREAYQELMKDLLFQGNPTMFQRN